MKIRQLMERVGTNETGRTIAYLKDALEEINLLSETHVKIIRLDIEENKRFYKIPNEVVKILDIRAKNHNNANNNYKAIPRSVYEPETKDTDGI